ncbi:Bestrophin/UPF0187 [Peziza echinospora]|nr:Bestrophin/UPF0187 [Peziza echinospora]
MAETPISSGASTANGFTRNGASSRGGYESYDDAGQISRKPTFPLSRSSRQKVRRWPLAFRFIKGSIHHVIIIPVLSHTAVTSMIVYLDQERGMRLRIPSSIVPSLSIVVGLMLVFRNGTSYERFWGGRCNLQQVVTSVRNLTRSFLVCGPDDDDADRAETEKVVRALVGMLFVLKNHLRSEWTVGGISYPEYSGLLPQGLHGHEAEGVGLFLELAFVVERYIKRGVDRGAFNAPQSSMLSSQVNNLIDYYGKMETIKLTPIPVCHQIHQKQALALYCTVLPFCLVDELGWMAVPIIFLICFTLYGIEGIGEELEDPFGMDKNDIKIDAIITDCKQEVMVMLASWKKNGESYSV